ncbi:MAG: CUAEP/CCAEP-tail radical SAM protein [Vicinamibacterales bacterium]
MPSVLLISTYDLGRQPFGLGSATAALRAAGAEVACADLSRDRLAPEQVGHATLVGFFLPMHTATRLAVPVIARVRDLNPTARLCAFGLYAPLNADLLRELGVDHILGAEFEDDLGRLVTGAAVTPVDISVVPRVTFRVPERDGLPALSRYATLRIGRDTKVVGYTEASRGCKHTCRHCPIVPVYDGRFRVVPIDVVLADVRAQIAAGASHLTFGDPDFFNGIRHAMAVVHAVHAEWPDLSYDVTIKIEHLLAHADRLPELAATGCAFVTSAVESVDDGILERLAKGHTRADFERAVGLCRAAGLSLSPTFVAFTPWTTLAGYCALLQMLDRLGLIEPVAPIQLAIRLLVTAGSRLLELPEIVRLAPRFDAETMTYPWRHLDPEVDRLHAVVAGIAGDRGSDSRRETFDQIWLAAHAAAGLTPPTRATVVASPAPIAYMSEPWYCCAEPTPAQEALI